MQRKAVAIVIVLAALAAGCSSSHSPTSPQPASVEFDSLAIVNVSGTRWLACFVSNIGQSTAYQVRVYWHFTGNASAQESLVQPPDLTKGQAGFALTTPADNPAWTWPTAADSIRWSETPFATGGI